MDCRGRPERAQHAVAVDSGEAIAVVLLIGALLVLGLAYGICSLIRISRTTRTGDRPLQPDVDDPFARGHDRAAEAREADLSRRLLSGRLNPVAYQQAMTELARADCREQDAASGARPAPPERDERLSPAAMDSMATGSRGRRHPRSRSHTARTLHQRHERRLGES